MTSFKKICNWIIFRPKAEFAALFGFFLFACLVQFPHLLSCPQSCLPDKGDCFHNIWTWADSINRLATPGRSFFVPNILYPEPNVFAYQEPQLANTAIFFLFNSILNNSILSFNLMLVLAFVGTGLAFYFFLRDFRVDRGLAFLSSTAFTFCAMRMTHVPHIQTLMFFWVILPLRFLLKYLMFGLKRDAGFFFVFIWLGLGSIGYLPFYLGLLTTGFLLAFYREHRKRVIRLAGLGIVSLLLSVPFYIPFLKSAAAGRTRPFEEMSLLSTDLAFFFAAPKENWLYGHITRSFYEFQTVWGNIAGTFSGFVVFALMCIGLYKVFVLLRQVKSSPLHLSAISAASLFFFFLMLGPKVLWKGQELFVNPIGYPILKYVPGFNAFRLTCYYYWPFLFATLAVVALAPPKFLLTFIRRPAVVLGLALLILAEAHSVAPAEGPYPTEKNLPAHYTWLKTRPRNHLIELPISQAGWDVFRFMYFSTFHGHDIVNGMTGFAPPWAFELEATAKPKLTDGFVPYLKKLGFSGFIVLNSDFDASYRQKEVPQSVLDLLLVYQDEQVTILKLE